MIKKKKEIQKEKNPPKKKMSFYGPPWSANIAAWPGVAGISGITNHYSMNPYNNDPQYSSVKTLTGGRKNRVRKTKRKKFLSRQKKTRQRPKRRTRQTRRARQSFRGGSVIPTDFSGIGKYIGYSAQSLYNTAVGVNPLNANGFPINPNPNPAVQGPLK